MQMSLLVARLATRERPRGVARSAALAPLLALVLGAAGCHDPLAARPDGYEDCTHGGLLSFFVTTRDSVTGAYVTVTDGATLTWRAGLSTGTEYPGPGRSLPGGVEVTPTGVPGPYGRPGTFDVVVRVPGYREWRRAGVQVAQGAAHCDVREIVELEARLQRP